MEGGGRWDAEGELYYPLHRDRGIVFSVRYRNSHRALLGKDNCWPQLDTMCSLLGSPGSLLGSPGSLLGSPRSHHIPCSGPLWIYRVKNDACESKINYMYVALSLVCLNSADFMSSCSVFVSFAESFGKSIHIHMICIKQNIIKYSNRAVTC